MTEEHQFQAPPAPPKAPSFGGPAPAFPSVSAHADSAEVPPNNFAAALKISPRIFETKFMLAIFGVCIFIGLALGALFFGGSSAPVVQMPRDAIRGVIENPDIRQKLTRCGMVPPSSACLVYLVNHTPDDHYAEYFFET
ncbi:MAG: hypothetical protein SPL08_03330, partial [Pseudomonadota bacterium]|nr:hypothetical protein [Pseudomonadota bacterium]